MKARYLFPNDYMADPAAHVFNGRLFIYPSHDWDSGASFDDDGGHFQMKDYHVLSFGDVEHDAATDHGVILSVEQIPWAEKQLWDNDCVEKDGHYYLIYSAKDYLGQFHLGVAVADRPEGPFTPQPDPIRGSYSIDPCVFKDDDGQVYCYFGGIWGGQLQWYEDNRLKMRDEQFPKAGEPAIPSRVARMTDDVLQFSETPRSVLVVDADGKPLTADNPHRFFEASWMHKYQGKYYFSYSTGDTHLLCYAIGDNPYGPFTFQGVILDPVVGWTTHHSIVEHRGQWYLCYHDCIPSNDRTWLRSLKVQRLFYHEDGTIQKVVNE
jgi:hypothetical protein